MTDYLYSDLNQNHDIFLHDCFADAVSLHRNILIFHFSEGFYLGETNPKNPFQALAYTGDAEMRIQLVYTNPDVNLNIYLMKETTDGTYRQEISLEELRNLLKKGEKLEFLYTYQGIDNDSVLFRCEMHFDKYPFRRECVLLISTKEISYHWNELFQENS